MIRVPYKEWGWWGLVALCLLFSPIILLVPFIADGLNRMGALSKRLLQEYRDKKGLTLAAATKQGAIKVWPRTLRVLGPGFIEVYFDANQITDDPEGVPARVIYRNNGSIQAMNDLWNAIEQWSLNGINGVPFGLTLAQVSWLEKQEASAEAFITFHLTKLDSKV